jgi:hypothetical protein
MMRRSGIIETQIFAASPFASPLVSQDAGVLYEYV